MPLDIIPRSFFDWSDQMPSIFNNDDWRSFMPSSGLSISEDEKNVFVEAAVPGIDPGNIEVTYDKGLLWIRGNQDQKEEDKNKKFYRRASSAFSYRVQVPGKVDENADPDVVIKNGMLKATFPKLAETQPKKLNIRTE
jgi:HSP20 family protein